MLYRIVRPIATIAFKIFFKHIHVSGLDNIPLHGPVLIGSNHPTAFIEPCVMACLQPRTLNFIVRGDIFKKPFYIKLLRSLNLIPIFRFKDGYSSLKNNQETFKYVNEVLRDRQAIFILPEGRTIQEKRLRPLQKGIARMAFGAYEAFGVEDTLIVPVGITYEQADAWRKDLIIACGKPIAFKDYIKKYNENENAAIQELTSELEERMPEYMVIIPDKLDEDLVDFLCLIKQNDSIKKIWPIVIYSNSKLKVEQKISNKVSKLNETEKKSLKLELSEYKRLLNKHRINEAALSNRKSNTVQLIIVLILGAILFIPGLVFNGLIVFISKYIAKKKVYVKEFYAPVLFALCTFLFLIWYILFIVIGAVFIGWIILPVIVLLFISGYLTILFIETIIEFINKLRFNSLDQKARNQLKELRSRLKNFSE